MSSDGYTLLGKENELNNDEALPEEVTQTATKSDDGYVGDDGYEVEDEEGAHGYQDVDDEEYDYHALYFEPAKSEEALVVQLSAKLAITEIPREELE
jgi:hypothetical protein